MNDGFKELILNLQEFFNFGIRFRGWLQIIAQWFNPVFPDIMAIIITIIAPSSYIKWLSENYPIKNNTGKNNSKNEKKDSNEKKSNQTKKEEYKKNLELLAHNAKNADIATYIFMVFYGLSYIIKLSAEYELILFNYVGIGLMVFYLVSLPSLYSKADLKFWREAIEDKSIFKKCKLFFIPRGDKRKFIKNITYYTAFFLLAFRVFETLIKYFYLKYIVITSLVIR